VEEVADDFDLIIIGTGSGNSILTPDHDHLRVAIVEKDIFGGTCLNRGCVPTKMFVYAADVAWAILNSEKYGIDATIDKVRWPDIVDRIFDRIDPIPAAGKIYRETSANTTVFTGEARFVAQRVIEVDGQRLSAENIIIAAGGRPFVPDLDGLGSVNFETSDTIMRLPSLPERLVILGAGYIASEMAHVFGSFGTKVSIISRNTRLVSREDESISQRFTSIYQRRYDCHLNARVDRFHRVGDEIAVSIHRDGRSYDVTGDALLVAVGRIPNSDLLDVGHAGIDIDHNGYIVTDDYLRTTAPGVWALGDISNDNQLKHVANAEARAVAHNIIHPEDLRTADLWPIPHAIFGHPQIASVGQTEQDLRHSGRRHVIAIQDYGEIAYGWAMEDTEHFCKLIADPDTHLLLGAHIIGPYASMLLQQLIQGMKFGQTVEQLARGQLYIHPTLNEVVENALLKFLS
jgi:mycothione reductase